jgi:hypothetical protein
MPPWIANGDMLLRNSAAGGLAQTVSGGGFLVLFSQPQCKGVARIVPLTHAEPQCANCFDTCAHLWSEGVQSPAAAVAAAGAAAGGGLLDSARSLAMQPSFRGGGGGGGGAGAAAGGRALAQHSDGEMQAAGADAMQGGCFCQEGQKAGVAAGAYSAQCCSHRSPHSLLLHGPPEVGVRMSIVCEGSYVYEGAREQYPLTERVRPGDGCVTFESQTINHFEFSSSGASGSATR